MIFVCFCEMYRILMRIVISLSVSGLQIDHKGHCNHYSYHVSAISSVTRYSFNSAAKFVCHYY